jgi:beta-lactamase superfamily II metal-dependent hydrolase
LKKPARAKQACVTGNTGFTKNGHSVVLRLTYGNVRMLLGGDLNIPSEKLLLKTLMGEDVPEKKTERTTFINSARKKLEVDIAKSCHHGSADFSSLFLGAVNPIVTVISSGDDEPHSNPRARNARR